MENNMEKKSFRNDMPKILLTDNEVSLREKYKQHFFAVFKSDEYTSFYILGDKGSENLDTIDYFVVSINIDGRIVSVLSNETGLIMKYVIESEFDNISCNAPSIEGGMHVIIHWPEEDNEDEEYEEE